MPEAAAAPALDPFADPPPQPMAEAETIIAEPAPEIELEADMDAALNAITADDLPSYDPALEVPTLRRPPRHHRQMISAAVCQPMISTSVPSSAKMVLRQ